MLMVFTDWEGVADRRERDGMLNTDGEHLCGMALVVCGGSHGNTNTRLFFLSFGVTASWQPLTCKSTIISVMLPRTVMKSKIFQVSRK